MPADDTAMSAPAAPHPARVVDAPLRPPWSEQGLFEVFRHRYILTLLVRREIAARYQGSVLGLLWSYVNPLTQFFIYYFVMGILFGRASRTEDFAVHVFAGLIVVHFFTETMNAGTRSIVRNKSLVQKMAVPREMFPVASMMVSLFHVVPQVAILLVATLVAWPSNDGRAGRRRRRTAARSLAADASGRRHDDLTVLTASALALSVGGLVRFRYRRRSGRFLGDHDHRCLGGWHFGGRRHLRWHLLDSHGGQHWRDHGGTAGGATERALHRPRVGDQRSAPLGGNQRLAQVGAGRFGRRLQQLLELLLLLTQPGLHGFRG